MEREEIMTRFKDFGAGSGEVEKQPLSFKLHDEEFSCIPAVQGKLMLNLVAEAGSEDPVKAAGIINTFFKQVLTDESFPRFEALLEDKVKIVTVETLANITAWLVEEYSGRPTKGPEVS
jgi:hypothetical protein